jgi:hypothetical protein
LRNLGRGERLGGGWRRNGGEHGEREFEHGARLAAVARLSSPAEERASPAGHGD